MKVGTKINTFVRYNSKDTLILDFQKNTVDRYLFDLWCPTKITTMFVVDFYMHLNTFPSLFSSFSLQI